MMISNEVNMFSENRMLEMRDGTQINIELKENGSPVWIIASHGIGEYLGRHKYLSELFGHEFNILQYDLRGHGKSSGKRAYVEDFSLFALDLKEIIHFLHDKYRMKRFALFGHSMGALITADYMQNFAKDEDDLYPERVILNAPPCGAPGNLGLFLKLLPGNTISYLSSFNFSYPIPGLVDLKYLSHDPRVREEYLRDDLNIVKLESKILLELMKTSQNTFSRPIRSKSINFISIGSADKVVSFEDAVHYFNFVDKTFKLTVFEGAFHEIHNEIEKYRRPYFEYLKNIFNEMLFVSTN
jgi:acylglycerol lipase